MAYNCPPDVSSEVPTSVHALRPGDIRVIGAMGDSLTVSSSIECCVHNDILNS